MSTELQFRIRKARVQFHHWLNNQQGEGDPSKNPLLITRRLKHIPFISLRNSEYLGLLNDDSKQQFSNPGSPVIKRIRDPANHKISIPPLPVVHYKPAIKKHYKQQLNPQNNSNHLPRKLGIIEEQETIHLHVVNTSTRTLQSSLPPTPPPQTSRLQKYSDPYQEQGMRSNRNFKNRQQQEIQPHYRKNIVPNLPVLDPSKYTELLNRRYMKSQNNYKFNNENSKNYEPEDDIVYSTIEQTNPDMSNNQLFVYYQHDNDDNELKASNFGMFSNFKGFKDWIMGSKVENDDPVDMKENISVDENSFNIEEDLINGHSTAILADVDSSNIQQEQKQLLAKSPINVNEFFSGNNDNSQELNNARVSFKPFDSKIESPKQQPKEKENESEEYEPTLPFDLNWKHHLHFAAERIFSDITNNQSTYASSRRENRYTGEGLNFFRRAFSNSTSFTANHFFRPVSNINKQKLGGEPLSPKSKKRIFKNPMNKVSLNAARMADGLERLEINKDQVDAGFRNFNDYSNLQYRYSNCLPNNYSGGGTIDGTVESKRIQTEIEKQLDRAANPTKINPIKIIKNPSETGTVVINNDKKNLDENHHISFIPQVKRDETIVDPIDDNLFEGFDGYYTLNFEDEIISGYQQESPGVNQ